MYFSHKPDILNNFFGFTALTFVFTHICLFVLLMNQAEEIRIFHIPLFLLALMLPLFIIGILAIISTCLKYFSNEKIKIKFSKFVIEQKKKTQFWSKAKRDTIRKIHHVILFCFLVFFCYITLLIVIYYAGSSEGLIPEHNNMLVLYMRLLNKPDSIVEILFSFGWFYYFLFFTFYIFCLFTLFNEFTRKSKNYSFPFNIFPEVFLSSEERESYGTYLYFAIGQLFAAFICPPMIFLSILGIGALSDLVTSQIGIRFDKTHILWNKNKTWEGTIAGVITTFVICLLFVGMLWAFIFMIIFLLCDIFTDKPIKLSDNLLIPISCSLTYILIRFFFNLNYLSIIVAGL